MAWIEWDDSLSVGVFTIDAQHKKLFRIINDLHEAMLKRLSDLKIGEIIKELEYYSKYHFKTEESYFEELNYYDKYQHKMEHKKFIEDVKKFENDYKKGVTSLSIDVMDYLKNWLINHIKINDQKYSKTFIERGIK